MYKRKRKGCKIKGCEEIYYAKNLCQKHYQKLKREQYLQKKLEAGKVLRKKFQTCLVEGCKDPLKGHFFCNKHRQNCFYHKLTNGIKKDYYLNLMKKRSL